VAPILPLFYQTVTKETKKNNVLCKLCSHTLWHQTRWEWGEDVQRNCSQCPVAVQQRALKAVEVRSQGNSSFKQQAQDFFQAQRRSTVANIT
jgi:hypothetical protein